MLYPTIKQYIDALGFAEDNFDQLASFRLVPEADGSPVMSSGNFAVVFKMQDTRDGSFHALKCFLKDQPGRAEAYRAIADELEQVVSPYLTRIQYLEGELFVGTSSGGAEYPVLVMDWVEGLTLDNYLRAHLSDPYALHLLAYQFGRLAAWLLTQPFAHGDLKPDNILVRPDGTLVLVDYDGMFVPAMQGQLAPEMGSPDFRHPDRTDADFSEHIDDFALASILLSLRAVAHSPDYLGRYGAADRLLLSEADYRSPEQSAFLRDEFPTPDAELNRIYALFLLALSECTLSQVSFRLFNLQKPIAPPPMPEMNTAPATKEEIAEGVVDAFGVVYSRDGMQLLTCQNKKISDYHVSNGCKVIRGGAFCFDFPDCKNLTTIILPEGLTHIGDKAFYECENLAAIILPSSLTHIGYEAFAGCEKLTAITLPDSLTHIEEGAFSFSGIRFIINQSPHFTFIDGCLIDKRNHKLLAFFSDQEQVVLPDSLTHIGNEAFAGCEKLTTITLPANLTHIGDIAFYGCENLTAITLPAGLTHIGDWAFWRCYNLTSITLPDSLSHIGNGAFSECSSLTTITLPDSLTHIEDSVFSGCENLTTITLPARLTHIGNLNSDKRILNSFKITMPAPSLKHIGNGAFSGCEKLTAITLPDSLIHIGDYAFSECSSLTSITLPDVLTYIGDHAFSRCVNLTAIILPSSLTHIGNGAFSECSSLPTITLPDCLTHIGEGAFSFSGIKNVINQSPLFTFIDGCLIDTRNHKLLTFFSNQEQVVLPDGLTHIGNEAFAGCEKLTTITLPASLTHIGDWAFNGCENLTAITLPAGLSHIGDWAFFRCYNLTTITLPDSLIHIGDYAFSECSSLTTITLPESLTQIGHSVFSGCDKLTAITLPNSLTHIGNGAFYGCSNLTAITLPNTLTHIGNGAFKFCKKLTVITLPTGLTYIGDYVFSGCGMLNTITQADRLNAYLRYGKDIFGVEEDYIPF